MLKWSRLQLKLSQSNLKRMKTKRDSLLLKVLSVFMVKTILKGVGKCFSKRKEYYHEDY